jgi:glutathione S-transferase
MFTLYHHPICPLSRQIRVLLRELEIESGMIKEDYWQRRKDSSYTNPAYSLPVVEDSNTGKIIFSVYAIIEYINDTQENFYFMPKDILERIEVRKSLFWFNDKFYREVSKILIDEKMIRLLLRKGAPRTDFLRAANRNLGNHLKFLSSRLERNSYVASEKLSCADIAAAAHISVVDYFGEITWDIWPIIKNWYSIIKSRPSFRPLLLDHIPGFTPPKTYTDLDF